MGFEVVMGKKGRLGGTQPEAVTLNLKLGRIVILTHVYAVMKSRFEREVEFVQLLFDEDRRDVFLIQPCNREDRGARKLDITKGTSPSLSARFLFNKLGLPRNDSRRSPVSWDKDHGGLLVHWTKRIDSEDTIEAAPPT